MYLQACRDFASALAEHFDGDPRVEFIDIRPFGNWGEWHFSQVTGSDMPEVKIQNDMIKHYKDVFEKTLLAVPSDVYGEVYGYSSVQSGGVCGRVFDFKGQGSVAKVQDSYLPGSAG